MDAHEIHDHLFRPSEAIRQVTGRRIHRTTALRWCLQGFNGVRLESYKVGRQRFCTIDQVKQFIERTTAASTRRVETAKEIKSEIQQRIEVANDQLKREFGF